MAESFLHILKVEAIHGMTIRTRAEMRNVVFEYIEVDYKRQRRHSAHRRRGRHPRLRGGTLPLTNSLTAVTPAG